MILTVIHHFLWVQQYPSAPVPVQVLVEDSFVGVDESVVVVSCYHHLSWVESGLVGDVAPPHLQVGACLVVVTEVLHVLSEGRNLHCRVLPHQSPSSSIVIHVAVELH